MEPSSNKVKAYLLANHITDDDIKGHGKHGRVLKSDRMRAYMKLQKKSQRRARKLPVEVVEQIIPQLPEPTRRLINKQYKEIDQGNMPWLPEEIVDIVVEDVNLPVARLISKKYESKNQALFETKSHETLFNFVTNYIDYGIVRNLIDWGFEGFTSEQDFIDYQWQKISNLTNDELMFYHMLIKMLKQNQIINVDEDHWHFNRSSGFVFIEDKILFIE